MAIEGGERVKKNVKREFIDVLRVWQSKWTNIGERELQWKIYGFTFRVSERERIELKWD